MLLTIGVVPAFAVTTGFGQMTVNPSSVTAGTAQDMVFTFTDTGVASGASAVLQLVIPSGWTTPTTSSGAGQVTTTNTSCSSVASPTVSSMTVQVLFNCNLGTSFTLTYHTATAQSTPQSGVQFLTKTTQSGGTASAIGASPTVNVSGAAATLAVSAPSTSTAGNAINVTVTAQDSLSSTATGYTGTVHFTSSTDPLISAGSGLPPDYTFVSGDNGVHTFSVTFKTSGTETVTATDTVTASITGTSSGTTVSPAAASQLKFTPAINDSPALEHLTAGSSAPVTVAIEDQFGNLVPDPGVTVDVAIGFNANAATLGGTTGASTTAGVASFSDLTLDQEASGYTLTASAFDGVGLSGTSAPFAITSVPVTVKKITPNFGAPAGANTVTITGTGFVNGSTTVMFGSMTSSTVTFVSSKKITAVVPGPGTGAVHVSVTTPNAGSDDTTAASLYSYGPQVTKVSPNLLTASNTSKTITISGHNLLDPVSPTTMPTVTFVGCNTSSSVTGTKSTSLKVVVPTQMPDTTPCTGPAQVQVTTSAGSNDTTSSADLFYYGPLVTAVAPKIGPASGLTTKTVAVGGKNFTGATSVAFGANTISTVVTSCSTMTGTSFIVKSATSISVCGIPAQLSGDLATVDVVVTTANGSSAHTLKDHFTYGPLVNNVSPAKKSSTTTKVTINGKNFAGATDVFFGGNDVPTSTTGVVINSTGTTITIPVASLPSVSSGTTLNVTVVGPAGTSPLTAKSVFTF